MKNVPPKIMNLSASDILSLLRALINALSSTYNFCCIFVYGWYVLSGTVERVAAEERHVYL